MPADTALVGERVAAVMRRTPLAVAVTVVNAGLMAGLLAGLQPDARLFPWLAATLGLALLRLGLWWRFVRAGPAVAADPRWRHAATGAAVLAGLAWGAGAAWLWPAAEAYRLFWVFVIGGMCAGAATLHHVHLPSAIGFILPAGLPVVLRMAMEGGSRDLVGAAMVLVFLGALVASAQRSSRAFGETLRLRLDLARQTRELEAARASLAAEIAEHRATEASLRHAQKMEAVGQLAGGIAHDFNNVLQAVASGAALIRRRAADRAAVAQLAERVADAARRGESVTRRLLALSRRGALQAEPLDVHDLLHGMRDILAATLQPGLSIEVRVPPGLPRILADRGQLETALVNLAVNARDAMPGGGTLTLAAAPGEADPPQGGAGTPPAASVRLLVADTGTGMDAQTLSRAAEPFFTTKPPGRGTGLGLATVRTFAEASGGAFAIASEPGRGTCIRLWLPAAPAAVHTEQAPRPATPPSRPANVLLVDDEPAVLASLAEELAAEGCNVVAAPDGTSALHHLAAGQPCDVVVTDLVMGGVDGLALIREARRHRAGLPAVVLTGQSGDDGRIEGDATSGGPYLLLRKPIGGDALARRLAAFLAAERAGRAGMDA